MGQTITAILVLLVVSNGTPIIAARVFGTRVDSPVDMGRRLADGRPLFGTSKTWRGLAVSLLSSALCAPWLGFSMLFGLVFASLAMAGDLFSSFIKRRMGLESSEQALGLDQLPEALLPSVYAVAVIGISWWWIILLPLLFMVMELLVSVPLYHLKIRRRPY